MTMALDYRPQPPVGGGIGYEQNRYSQPQFTNPWQATASAGSPPNPLYQANYQHSPTSMDPPSVSKAPPVYVANPAASSLGSDLVPTRSYGSGYSSSATSNPAYTATAGARYSPEQVPTSHPYSYPQDLHRRDSYPTSNSSHASFSDEMAGARGMVAMANGQDITPRNIYNTNGARSGSHDSYGFPATTHSQHSSISSATGSGYPYYGGSYNGSVDGSSVTDYSSASEDTRPLPPPNQLINGFPPEPQAMMNQFNAKMSPSAQKKHKCKICDKRFTRPSSLQTHMYSHTGEKPFACEHPGCGRHFSVVSNLRRHRKVHKQEGAGSNEDDS